MDNKRIAYFDFLRGIAIIMVVGIHTFPLSYSNELLYVSIRQILNCAVPLFLAVSGFFIAKKDFSTPQLRKKFWKKQIPTVYVPCLVFSCGWFFLEVYGARWAGLYMNLFKLLFCGFSVYYFIALIIQCYILAPILLRHNNLSGGVLTTALLSAICVVVVSYVLYVRHISVELLFYAGPCVLWIFFFMLGIYLRSHRDLISLKKSLLVLIVGFASSVAETYFYKTCYTGGYGIKLSSFIFSTGAILCLFSPAVEKKYSNNYPTALILRLGEISFGIYFLHMYVKWMLSYLHLPSYWVLDWGLLLIISALIIVVSKKIFSSKINRRLFGFR